MYHGKQSRNPYIPLLIGILFFLALLGTGIFVYADLSAWEEAGKPSKYSNAFMVLLYDLLGKKGPLLFFWIAGSFLLLLGLRSTRDLLKIKREGFKNH